MIDVRVHQPLYARVQLRQVGCAAGPHRVNARRGRQARAGVQQTLEEQRANLPDGGSAPASISAGGMVSGAIAGSPPLGVDPAAAADFSAIDEEEEAPATRW